MAFLDVQNTAFAGLIAGEPGPETAGYVAARAGLEQLQKGEPAADIATNVIQVPGKCGPTAVTIVRQKSLAGKKVPIVYYLHGGGWVLGSPTVYAAQLEDLARETGAAIAFPYYTPAPDQQFPFQFEQTYEALHHLVTHGDDYDLLTSSIALAGDSVGGHFTIALMQMALERSLPATVAHIVMFYPVTDTHKKLPSYEKYKDGPFLTEASMDWMIDAFLPNKEDRELPLTSPLTFLADSVLAQFPPTTVILSGSDVLLDEGLAFGERLCKAGVDTSVVRAEGTMHAFLTLKPIRESPIARAMTQFTAARLCRALGCSPAKV
ncbi:vegetative specific protein H5 [Microdochium trichocladiopsis]|uniref:Vegetative specific protein H5 n=1 Tax=Microdochium trichocladiopsis TaxID=1682393 RepID=A0A9P8Y3Z0_9PEZI|nr:vegetative specific protein H5 [Microdochium trichocladiopsis]KAH7028925.1 vegetative specific protein H5 [Microdochium trichocladiopsis]